MKDSVNSLFQQRFQGHEMPVDPSVWAGIESQVGVPVADGVNDLFRDRFQGHEMAVDPAVWSGISSQLGHTAVVGTTAGSVLGWAAAGVVAIALGTSIWLTRGFAEPVDLAVVHQTITPKVEVSPLTQDAQALPVEVITPEVELVPTSSSETIRQQPAEQTPKKVAPRTTKKLSDTIHTDALKGGGSTLEVDASEPEDKASDAVSAADGAAIVESIIQGMTAEVHQEEPRTPEKEVPVKPVEAGSAEESVQPPALQQAETPLPKLYMPNTFTPNGDGVNDYYEVGGVKAYGQVIIHVTSLKTGQTVFSTNSGEPWYGNGCEDGMYLVALEAQATDGRSVTEGKVVWLNRNPMN